MDIPLSDQNSLRTRFSALLLDWHLVEGRHDLPWQQPATPYRVWISEIMLQQTRVQTVLPYFERWMAQFPDVEHLADAPVDRILELWSGLGYYARARNVHRSAQQLATQRPATLPDSLEGLTALPGIGRSTAGAILSIGFGKPAAILDGNVRRVLCRVFGIDAWPGLRTVEQQLWKLSESLLPAKDCGRYTQAIMDLGATCCTRRRPTCERCPLQDACVASQSGRTEELPIARPRKSLRERHRYVLVRLDGAGRVLLEKRPQRGIWGGLWSLPESGFADSESSALARWRDDGLLPAESELKRLAPIRHDFTHYRLQLSPILVTTEGPCAAPLDSGGIDAAATLSMPAEAMPAGSALRPDNPARERDLAPCPTTKHSSAHAFLAVSPERMPALPAPISRLLLTASKWR